MADTATVRMRKRYKAALSRLGVCMACAHRDPAGIAQGRAVCRIGVIRQHPECESDGRGLTFKFDPAVMEGFADAS